jgi:uncharacterized protein DUF6603
MAGQAGSLERLAIEYAVALRELAKWLDGDEVLSTLQQFGASYPSGLLTHAGFATAQRATVGAANELGDAVGDLMSSVEAGDVAQIVARALHVLDRARALTDSLGQLSAQLQAAGTALGVPAAQVNALTTDLPRKLVDFTLTQQLDLVPAVGATMTMLGIVERTFTPAQAGTPAFEVSRLRLDRFGPVLTRPADHLQALYDWGAPGFDGTKLLPAIDQLVAHLGLPSRFRPPGGGQRAAVEAFAVELTAAPGSPPGLTVGVLLPIGGAIDRAIVTPHPAWTAHVNASARVAAGATGTVRPPLAITLSPPSGEIRGDAELRLEGRPAEPLVVVGQAGGTRIQVGSVDASLGFDIAWDAATRQATIGPRAGARVAGGKLVVDAGQADGFIAKLLSGVHLESDFDAGLAWTPKTGVQFAGSATLEIALPVHVSLGPIDVPSIYLALGLKNDGAATIELSADIKAMLGPITAIVTRMGATADLRLPPPGGHAGQIELDFRFKPPRGVGLSLDAGPVRGGGFLDIDPVRREYAGMLELDLAGIVAVKAIGLISTRMPDGSDGFSLLIVITAEFGTGIQLGFGFTLLGVGGILGLNRGMALQPLVEGVRGGSVERIMFPHDIIANAPQIVSDLRTLFPVEQGTFVIGPMAKLGWGTPTLVSLSVAVIIEIPGNVAIVGVLKVALPAEDVAIVLIQVAFAGAIEFDRKRVYFFASIFDSRILFLTLEGEMGVLAAFGDDADFVLSLGGFHPSFQPPPLPFPAPKRIAIDILNTATEKLRVEGYFAVTTNTLQFGARVDLRMGFDECGIEGHVAFDALVQFSPLYFIVSISASISLKVFGIGLFSVRLSFELSGPAPWRAKGSASLSLLFFDIDVDFDVTWGERRDSELPPVAVMSLLKAELTKPQTWRAVPPPGADPLVSLRRLDPAVDTLVLHPVGVLRVSQRAVPLDMTFTRVGSQRPTDVKRLTVTVASGGLAKQRDVEEQFAPAQFQDFADAEKISKPAFQEMHGGLDLSVDGQQLRSGALVKRVVRFELITIDGAFRDHQRFPLFFIGLFVHLLAGNAVAFSVLSLAVKQQHVPFADKVEVTSEPYVVASAATNVAVATFASEAMAHEHLAHTLAGDPALHVIPGFEAAA